MTLSELATLVRRGESDSVEFKKSTGQLSRAAETLCAFLNGHGGVVVIGVSPDKKVIGQIVADRTLQDLAQCFRRFEPTAPTQTHRVPLPDSDREVLVLQADASYENRPFAFDGRPYERIGSTTSVMPQETYQRLLLERSHAKQRWENLPAAVTLEDLDQEEILKTLRLGAAAGRMPATVSADAADVLDRLDCGCMIVCSMPRPSSLGAGCFRIIPSANCGWPVSAGATRRSSSINGRLTATHCNYWKRRCSFSRVTYRWQAGSNPACSNGLTHRCSRP